MSDTINGLRLSKIALKKSTPITAILLLTLVAQAACRPPTPTVPPLEPPTPTDPDAQATSNPPTTEAARENRNSNNASLPETNTGNDDNGLPPTVQNEPESCESPQTQMEMNRCAADDYTQTDDQHKAVYETFKATLSDAGQRAFTQAELAWVNFRSLDCAFARDKYAGGSIAPLIHQSCMTERTESRTLEIQNTQLLNISYALADTQLNQTYQDVLAVITERRVDAFIDAQLAWLDYRDRNCTFEVLHSTAVIEESQCLARMSEMRTAQLLDTLEQNSL